MDINDEKIKKKAIELSKLQDELREKHFSWFKNVITLAIGLFGIIVSLKGDNDLYSNKHVFFIISISTLAFGILCGIAVLYQEIHVIKKVKKIQAKNILKMLDDEKVDKLLMVNPDKIYKYLEIGSVSSFILALISLVIYSSL